MNIRHVLLFVVVVATSASAQSKPRAESRQAGRQFLINSQRPFVYLKFERMAGGENFRQGEPKSRIWFRLVNNGQLPISVRTFGVPEGSPAEEVGLMHEVVANPPSTDGVLILNMSQAQAVAEPSQTMPRGYGGHVSSSATLGPAESLLFSIPLNHLSDKWHIEIPFRFEFKRQKPMSRDESIGGQPELKLTYSFLDLPSDVQKKAAAIK